MVQHVHERASQARSVDRVLVATDDARIVAAVQAFGGEALMTSSAHATGTDRLAEAAAGLEASIVVNVQGDEPLLDPAFIEAAVFALGQDPGLPMATVSVPFRTVEEIVSASVVKVVVDGRGDALLFSRTPIPHVRAADADPRAQAEAILAGGLARRHVGLYAYRREALVRLAALPPAPLEQAEQLEQLRALHHGMAIRVVPLQAEAGPAVDTPEDLERVRALWPASHPPTLEEIP